MEVTVDTDTDEYSEWIRVCKQVAKSVETVDGVLIMSGETHLYFDAGAENGLHVSESIADAFTECGFENVHVSGIGFSHGPNLDGHSNTKEIRANV